MQVLNGSEKVVDDAIQFIFALISVTEAKQKFAKLPNYEDSFF